LSGADFEFGLWLSALPLLLVAATLTWLLSLPLRNVGIVDPLWSLMLFAAGVVYALDADPRAPRLSPVLWLCAAWAARFAWQRARDSSGREPAAYAELRARHAPHFGPKSLLRVFVFRALTAWVVSLPLLGAFASTRPLGWLDRVGMALWLVGFLFEALADRQRRRFEAAGAGAVVTTGLWRYSRHPDFFGECCTWWGFYAFAVAAGAWWTLPGPVLLTCLLLRAAGVTPFHRGGGNSRPDNADYVLKTNAFFPGPPRN
jgi:steroid 5-alpha reductase family enzyme